MSRGAGHPGAGGRLAEAWYDPAPSSGARLLLGALAPAGWAFGAAARLRGAAYDRGLLPVSRAPVPVLSVGNLAVGGAGKTPVVLALAERLLARGARPAVLTRGYGATVNRARVVCAGDGPCLDASEAGDEPTLLARRLPALVVLAGPDRAALAERAVRDHGATVCLLDDGLQHRRLHRDLDLVVLDASAPLGNGRRLPAGPLREGIEALDRAHLVWLSRADRPGPGLDALLAEAEARGLPVVRSRYRPTALVDVAGGAPEPVDALAGARVLALSGIARPEGFRRTLEALGAEVVAEARFPDHHRFAAAELEAVRAEAEAAGARIVTTEKDAARLGAGAGEVRALRVDVELLEGEAALAAALSGLAARAGAEGR